MKTKIIFVKLLYMNVEKYTRLLSSYLLSLLYLALWIKKYPTSFWSSLQLSRKMLPSKVCNLSFPVIII